MRACSSQVLVVAAQKAPGAVRTGHLWKNLACLERLETGGHMRLDFLPPSWSERSKGLTPYPLGQSFRIFPINRLGIGHCFLRQGKSLFTAASIERNFGLDRGKPIVDNQSSPAKALGNCSLLCHTRKSILMMTQPTLNPS